MTRMNVNVTRGVVGVKYEIKLGCQQGSMLCVQRTLKVRPFRNLSLYTIT